LSIINNFTLINFKINNKYAYHKNFNFIPLFNLYFIIFHEPKFILTYMIKL